MRKHVLGAALTALLALAALAAPAAASASPVLEYAGWGVEVPVGEPITGSSTNLRFYNGANSMSCNETILDGSVAANSGSEVVAEFNTASFTNNGGKCPIESLGAWAEVESRNTPWCLSSTALGVASLKSCGAEPLTLAITLYSSGGTRFSTCVFTAKELAATYKNVNWEPLKLLIGGQPITRQIKPTCTWGPSTWYLSGSFELTTEGGEFGTELEVN